MSTFRGLFVRKDSTGVGTGPVDARKALAGLVQRLSSGAPRQGLLSPVQVVGTTGWAYSVPAAWWVTSRGLSDGVVLAGSDGVVSVATDPAPATGARIDVIYVLHRDVDQADPDSESVVSVAIGLASGSPVAPAIPTGAMEIARATVSSGNANTAAATISQTATYSGIAGADIVVPGSAGPSPFAALDTLVPAAPNGSRVLSLADGVSFVRAGGAWRTLARVGDGEWQSYTPTWVGLNLGSGATNVGKFTRIGNTILAAGRVQLGTGGSASDLLTFTLPASIGGPDVATGANVIGRAYCPNGGAGQRDAYLIYGGSNNLVRLHVSLNDSRWGVGVPTAWAASNQFSWHLSYQAG